MKKILFLCTGNTCRSPMAASLLTSALIKREVSGSFLVASAGMAAREGLPATPEAIAVMEDYGIDISNHRSKMVSMENLTESAAVFTMTRRHYESLLALGSECCAFLKPLLPFALGIDDDVSDPFGAGPEAYRHCAESLYTAVEALADKLIDRFMD